MSDRPSQGPAKPVRVRHGELVRELAPGEEVTFGRGQDVDIRLAADPPDLLVSRRTGLIRCLPDAVLVSNVSSRGVLQLSALGAATREIGPGEAITSEPHRMFRVVVIGNYGTTYPLDVDARALPSPADPSATAAPGLDPTVVSSPIELTATQRRVLAALCAPMLERMGEPAGPASAREIGSALGLQPNYVRNVLKEVREELSSYGVPGLVADGPPQPGEDFRLPLALWAIRYGLAREPREFPRGR